MISLIHASLNLPPSTNSLYGQRGSQRYKLPSVTQYQQEAMYTLRSAWQDRAQIDVARAAADITLYASIHAWMPPATYEKRDTDNLAKIVIDTIMNCYLQIDDSRITDLYICKRCSTKPRLYVSVAVLQDLDDLF